MAEPSQQQRHLEPVVADDGAVHDAEQFILRFGRSLHARAVPAHRLEEALTAMCLRLGLSANFFSTPTGLFAAFDEHPRQNVHLMRVGATSSDLGKLADIDEVSRGVARGSISTIDGLARIEHIEASPPRYGLLPVTACYAVNSAAASVFFGGGLREVLTALVIGLVTGLLALVQGRDGGPWRAFEAVAAFSAAVLATLADVVVGPVSVSIAALAGLIALLPGYTLTVAMAELANGHLASGSARATSAFMVFAQLGFGVALGTKATSLVLGATPVANPVALPAWAQLIALVVAAATFAVIFRVASRDMVAVLLVAVLGFSGTRSGSQFLGPELGVFVGALVVAVLSNLYARVFDRPAIITLLTGIMLLVPGSIGFRSLSSLLAHDVMAGVQTGFTMFLMAVALVAGLLVAHELVPARRAL